MVMNNYCVYIHTNKINGKIYIGITNNIERRWRNNGIEYKPKKDNTRPFWNAICKYGWENFNHEIVNKNLTFEDACELERYYIKLSGATNNNVGYNVAKGGNGGLIYKEHPKGMKGKKHTDNSKKQTSETIKNMVTKCCTKVKITMPNGEEYIFNKAREAIDFLGISTSIYYKLLKTGKPYTLSKNTTTNIEFLKTLEGLIIEKID